VQEAIQMSPPPAATDRSLFARSFDKLEVGDAFASRGRTVTEADIVGFSSLTGDWHPQHADAAWARHSEFGERIAHGMLVLAYAVGLVTLDPDRVLALRGIRDATFKAPVRIGETIHVEGKVSALKPLTPAAGLVSCAWRIVNQDGRTVVRLSVDVLWRRELEQAGVVIPISEAERDADYKLCEGLPL
jgi:3-hydroxybutyryl-CoA dehydratase